MTPIPPCELWELLSLVPLPFVPCTPFFFAPAAMLQGLFQSYFVTAGKPSLGLWLMVGAGIFNVVFDYVLIVPCQMGIAGAALATGIGQCIPALFRYNHSYFLPSEQPPSYKF